MRTPGIKGSLLAGVACTEITPDKPISMGGYGQRAGLLSSGVHDALFTKALYLEEAGTRLLIITADLISIPDSIYKRTRLVDDVVLGCVSAVGDQGADIAKVAALAAGWDEDVAGVTLNRFFASGAEAVNLAAMKIRSGWEQLVVGGGIESISRVPVGSDGGAMGMDPETALQTGFMPQGIGADLIATMDGFSRTDIDAYAAGSHRKAAAAWARGAFSKTVIPVRDRNGLTILARDETIRPDTSVESRRNSSLRSSSWAISASTPATRKDSHRTANRIESHVT